VPIAQQWPEKEGQRSDVLRKKAGHMTATCKDRRQLKITLAKQEPSTHDSAIMEGAPGSSPGSESNQNLFEIRGNARNAVLISGGFVPGVQHTEIVATGLIGPHPCPTAAGEKVCCREQRVSG
jgi:hypothetical protein